MLLNQICSQYEWQCFIVQKTNISQPATTFNISEWDSYPSNYCQNLGTLSTSELIASVDKEIKIYPNPVYENIFVSGDRKGKIAQILIFQVK
jgi:hypothetical protein